MAGRNINQLKYAGDNTLMAESLEELKNFLMKVKDKSEKAGLKLNIRKKNKKQKTHPKHKNLNIQKMMIMASGPITSWQIDGKKETVTDFIFLGSKNTVDSN